MSFMWLAMRMSDMAKDADDMGLPGVSLIVARLGGGWQAAICEFGHHMPLLDNDGNESLAAIGQNPMQALGKLDAKLARLP